MNKNAYFKLFACCIPVKGAERSLVCDVQRADYQLIPNVLYDILTNFENCTVQTVLNAFEKENEVNIIEYLQFLIEKEYGFLCDNPEVFPLLSLEWKSAAEITNAIIDSDVTSRHSYNNLFKSLAVFRCEAIQLRFFSPIDIEELTEILKSMANTTFRSCDIVLNYNEQIKEVEVLVSLCKQYHIISQITVYNAPIDLIKQIPKYAFSILYNTQSLNPSAHCGFIDPVYFSINLPTFTESQHHNTCLNRKISIDQNGNIKNCPSMTESYGNIANTSLQEALNHPDFKKYWNIKKDKISVCQDCEFRHICTDCRAYLENPEDIYSKPLKCGYNPYTCEWEDWSTNPLKEKAIKSYGMTTM